MNWSHVVRVRATVAGRNVRMSLYCTRERNVLRAVGDCDVQPGQRVAIRKGEGWVCVLDWAAEQCEVIRHYPDPAPEYRIVTYVRRGDMVSPVLLTVTETDADQKIVRWDQLSYVDGKKGSITFPAHKAPYTRMAQLSPAEWEAYAASKKAAREARLQASAA